MEIDTDKKKDVSLDVEGISSVVVEEDIIAVEDDVADAGVNASESVAIEETFSIVQITYEDYKRMTPLEKAQSCGFTRLRSDEAVEGVVKLKFMELEHKPTTDELMEENGASL